MVETKDMTRDFNAERVVVFNPIAAGLSKLEEKYKGGPGDLSIPKEYEACRKALAETRGIRGKTEKLRKELKADALAYGRLVDSTAKGIIEKVQEIEEPFATAKKEHDTAVEIAKREKALAEERRVDGIATRIATINALVAAHVSSSSAVISALFPGLHEDLETCDEWAMEFAEKARATIGEAMAKLEELYNLKVQQEQAEAERIKAEKERAAQEEAARVQREKEAEAERERLALERERLSMERAKLEEERKRVEAEIQDERDRIAAAKAEQEKAIQAMEKEKEMMAQLAAQEEKEEQERVAAEEKERELQRANEKKENGNGGYTEDYKAAGNALLIITNSKPVAKAILDAIIKGEIPNIQYTGEV